MLKSSVSLFQAHATWFKSTSDQGSSKKPHKLAVAHSTPHKAPPFSLHPSPPSHITPSHEPQWGGGGGELMSTNERGPSNYPTNESVCEDYIAMTSRVVSSKPPSRYGPRPKQQDGVTPATVSLMLSGRRSHTPYTAHRPRPLHIRYFTKKNSSSFFVD